MVSIHETLTSESLSSISSVSEGEEFMTKSTKLKLKKLVPKYVRSLCKYPKTATLAVSHDRPTQDTTYKYTITWEQPLGDEESTRKILQAYQDVDSDDISAISPSPRASDSESFTPYVPRAVSLCRTASTLSNDPTQWSINKDFLGEPYLAGPRSENCSSTASNRFFLKSHVEEDRLVDILLIVLEPGNPGVLYNYFNAQLNSSNSLKEVVSHILLRENREPKKCLKRGTLYTVRLLEDNTRDNVMVPKHEYEDIKVHHCPLILCRAVFVLDLKEFVAEGVPVYF